MTKTELGELIGTHVIVVYNGEIPFRISGVLKEFNENGYWVEFVSNNIPCFVAFQENKIKSISDDLIMLKE